MLGISLQSGLSLAARPLAFGSAALPGLEPPNTATLSARPNSLYRLSGCSKSLMSAGMGLLMAACGGGAFEADETLGDSGVGTGGSGMSSGSGGAAGSAGMGGMAGSPMTGGAGGVSASGGTGGVVLDAGPDSLQGGAGGMIDAGMNDGGMNDAGMNDGCMTDNSVIGCWKFDDGQLNANTLIAIDSSPAGNDGTLLNFTTPNAWNTGNTNALFDGALEFDGVNDTVVLGDTYGFSKNTPFSVVAWVRRASVGSFQAIFGKLDLTSPALTGYGIGFSDSNEFGITLISDNSVLDMIEVETNNQFTTTNTWLHVAVTYDGNMAAGIELYVDGNRQNKNVVRNTLSGSIQTNQVASIGGTPDPADNTVVSNPISGTVADLRVHNRVLTGAEIANSRCADAPQLCP